MRTFLIVFALSLSVTLFAQQKSYLKPGRVESLNSDGIRLKLFKDAVPMPVAALQTRTLTRTADNGEKTLLEAYEPREPWMFNQCLGRWGNETATVSVFKLIYDVPKFQLVLDKFVLKEDYEKWEKDSKPAWDDAKAAEWVEYLAGRKSKGPAKVVAKNSMRTIQEHALDSIKSYGGGARQAAVFTVSEPGGKFYAVLYEYSTSLDQEKSLKTIDDSIKSVAFFSTQAAGVGKPVAKTGKKKEWSEQYLESKERVIQNIKNLKDWSYYETDNYIVVSNSRDKQMLSSVQEDIEKCRNVFGWFYPIKKPLDAVSVVRVFNKRSDYQGYVPADFKDFGGLWMSDRKELVISPAANASKKDNREIVLSTTYHEGFHQYIFYASGQGDTAMWFNEGNAELFENVDFKARDKFSIELSDEKSAELESFASKSPETMKAAIKGVLQMGYKEFYEKSAIRNNYSMALAIVYFLTKGAPVMKNGDNYSEILPKYYDAFLETRDAQKATEMAWKDVDMDKFSADFLEFWGTKKYLKAARKYLPPKAVVAGAD